jgi:DNA-binding CsgD family transcriptional regulator
VATPETTAPSVALPTRIGGDATEADASLTPAFGFVGREPELAALTRLLDQAATGRGGLALVAGDAGIGKTRLMEELAEAARRRGITTLWGRCFDGEGAPAFWPWVQVLRAALRGRDGAEVRADLGMAADLVGLLPELRTLLPDLPDRVPLPPDEARFRLFEAVTAFLAATAARGPLLLAMDDLHWADAASLALLQFLARQLGDVPLVVVGAYRDVEVEPPQPLATALTSLSRTPGYQRYVLHGLAPPAVAALLPETAGGLGDADSREAFAQELHRLTEGNPLFVHETMRHLVESGRLGGALPVAAGALTAMEVPEGVRSVIVQRLDRLPAEARRVLELAAVVGHTFDPAILTYGFEDARLGVLEALDAATRARLVRPNAGSGPAPRYQFTHPLIRQTLYDNLGAAARVRLHAQVGAALEARYGAAIEQHLSELAWHFAQAAPTGDIDKAVRYSERAAQFAARVCAHEEAVRAYEQGVALLETAPGATEGRRCELLLALGEARNRAGETEQGKAAFLEAARTARAIGWSAGLARAALGYGGVAEVVEWQDDTGVALLEEALGVLDEGEFALRARLQARLVLSLSRAAQRARGEALSAAAVAAARRAGDPAVLASALSVRCYALWAPHNVDERVALATEAIRHAAEAGDPELELQATRWLVAAELQQGNLVAVDRAIAALTRTAETLRQPYYQFHATVFRAMRALLDGRLVEAEQLARLARELGRRAQHPDADSTFSLQMVSIRERQGRAGELEEPLRALVERTPTAPGYHAVLATVYRQMGRVADARREYEALARSDFQELPEDRNWLVFATILARVCAYLGDVARAATLYRLLLPYRDQGVVSGRGLSYIGAASGFLGLLAATLTTAAAPRPRPDVRHASTVEPAQGALTPDVAVQHFEDAIAFDTRIGARLCVAQTQYDYAAFLLGLRGAAPATAVDPRALLDAALATGRELGMARLVEDAERLREQHRAAQPMAASAAGVRHYPDGLTAREVEVLRLLAAGLTNKEIAAALVVSDRTVGNHIANLYGKIGARRRADATAYALRHGLVAPEPPPPA